MKGNLSKKKGFLSAISNENLDYISDKVYGKAGFTKEDFEKVQADIMTINKGTEIRNNEVDDKLNEKEEKSNKVTAESEEVFLTDKEEASDEKYPSELYVQESLKELRDVALNGYGMAEEAANALLTKEDIKNKVSDFFAPERPDGAYPTASAVESFVTDKTDYLTANVGTIYELIDGMKTDIFNLSENKESISNKISSPEEITSTEQYFTAQATFELANSFSDSVKQFTNDKLNAEYYTKTEIDTMIGDIETALDSIIALQAQY